MPALSRYDHWKLDNGETQKCAERDWLADRIQVAASEAEALACEGFGRIDAPRLKSRLGTVQGLLCEAAEIALGQPDDRLWLDWLADKALEELEQAQPRSDLVWRLCHTLAEATLDL